MTGCYNEFAHLGKVRRRQEKSLQVNQQLGHYTLITLLVWQPSLEVPVSLSTHPIENNKQVSLHESDLLI